VLSWQIGVEIELIAPPGLSRETLAQKLCPTGGKVELFFHVQSELSKVSGVPIFDNLTTGFAVLDSSQKLIAKCVDDITLQYNLQQNMTAKAGWYRIVSDDRRFLELIRQQCDPSAGIAEVLTPIAKLFNTQLQYGGGNMVKVVDLNGLPIAIATPLSGERERPCEIITPPFKNNYYTRLANLLNTAVELDFTIPDEGATHIHFDASALADTRVFCNLVNLFGTYGQVLRQLVGTNSNCRRLGKIPAPLWELVNNSAFGQLSWLEAKTQLKSLKLTKYGDFNFKNLVDDLSDKYTLEVRIFPVWLEAKSIIMAAELIEGILNLALNSQSVPYRTPVSFNLQQVQDFLERLAITADVQEFWLNQAISLD